MKRKNAVEYHVNITVALAEKGSLVAPFALIVNIGFDKELSSQY